MRMRPPRVYQAMPGLQNAFTTRRTTVIITASGRIKSILNRWPGGGGYQNVIKIGGQEGLGSITPIVGAAAVPPRNHPSTTRNT